MQVSHFIIISYVELQKPIHNPICRFPILLLLAMWNSKNLSTIPYAGFPFYFAPRLSHAQSNVYSDVILYISLQQSDWLVTFMPGLHRNGDWLLQESRLEYTHAFDCRLIADNFINAQSSFAALICLLFD